MAAGTPKQETPQELAKLLLDILLRLNIRLETITAQLKPKLHVSTNHLLTAVYYSPGITASALVKLLQLEKSTVSRLINKLMQSGLLKLRSNSGQSDGREKPLSLTTKGEATLLEDRDLRDQQIQILTAPLNSAERKSLLALLAEINEAFGAPSAELTPEEEPIKVEIRRIARAMGLLGSDLLGTKRPVEHIQILKAIDQHTGPVMLTALDILLPYDKANLTRYVSALTKEGLIKQTQLSSDNRFSELTLTKAGANLLSQALHTAALALIPCCANFSKRSIEQLTTLVEKIAPTTSEPTLRDLEIDEISSDPKALHKARALLVLEAVRTGAAEQLPETLFSKSNRSFALKYRDNLVGAVEVAVGKSSIKVLRMVLATPFARGAKGTFLSTVVEKLSNKRNSNLGKSRLTLAHPDADLVLDS